MKTTKFLKNTDFSLNEGGYLDVLRNRMTCFVTTAGAITAINALDTAIIAERNNVHTLLGDGITDVAVTSVTHGTEDGGKLRYFAKGFIDAIEANVKFPGCVDTDPTIGWGSILSPAPTPIPNVAQPKSQTPETFKSFVNDIGTPYGYTANTRTLRATTIAAAYALYAAVASL